jgi:hypothetical protein
MTTLQVIPEADALVSTRPPSTRRIEVSYVLDDPAELLALAVEVGATVGHGWRGDRWYAYITQQKIGRGWYACLYWGDWSTVQYQARAAFDSPPLTGLTDGEPFTLPEVAA